MRRGIFEFVLSLLLISCFNNKPVEIAEIAPPITIDSAAYFDSIYAPYAHRIDSVFSRQHKRTQFYGNVLFAEKGRIIFEKAYGYKKRRKDPEVTLENTFQLASVSKTFTSVAILMLYERGNLNLTDTLQKFFPNFPYPNITIKLLLSHRSGLSKYTHFCDNPATVWKDKDCSIYNKDVLKIMKNIRPPLAASPNRKFYYTNTNFIILSSIIEKISGMTYSEFLTKNIFEPLKMESTRVYYRDNEGELVKPVFGYESNFRKSIDIYLNGCTGDKGIYSNVSDMFKFDQALYSDTLVSQKTLALAFTGYSRSEKWNFNMNYGYGFRMKDIPEKGKVIYHGGWWNGFRTYFIRLVEKKQTIIILSNVKRGPFLKVSKLAKLLPK